MIILLKNPLAKFFFISSILMTLMYLWNDCFSIEKLFSPMQKSKDQDKQNRKVCFISKPELDVSA